MQYQLTLQIRGDSLDDYDAMIELEDELAEELGDSADIDGHDVAYREVNGERYIVIWPEGSQEKFTVT